MQSEDTNELFLPPKGFPSKGSSHCSLPYEAFLRALHGFILVTTTQGKLVYVSENVTEYLGISMASVCLIQCHFLWIHTND